MMVSQSNPRVEYILCHCGRDLTILTPSLVNKAFTIVDDMYNWLYFRLKGIPLHRPSYRPQSWLTKHSSNPNPLLSLYWSKTTRSWVVRYMLLDGTRGQVCKRGDAAPCSASMPGCSGWGVGCGNPQRRRERFEYLDGVDNLSGTCRLLELGHTRP